MSYVCGKNWKPGQTCTCPSFTYLADDNTPTLGKPRPVGPPEDPYSLTLVPLQGCASAEGPGDDTLVLVRQNGRWVFNVITETSPNQCSAWTQGATPMLMCRNFEAGGGSMTEYEEHQAGLCRRQRAVQGFRHAVK